MASWQFWLLISTCFWSTTLQLTAEHTKLATTVTMTGLYISIIMIGFSLWG